MEIHTCTHGVEGMSLLIGCSELKAVEEESKCEKITRAFLLESRKLSSYRRDVLCVSVGDCPCSVSSRMRHVWCPVCPQCRLGPSSRSGSGAVFLSGDSPWSKWSLLLVSMSSWRPLEGGEGCLTARLWKSVCYGKFSILNTLFSRSLKCPRTTYLSKVYLINKLGC